jgi:hypothetical protein
MQDLQRLQTSQLVDLLAEQTSLMTAMFVVKDFSEEYEKKKFFLKAIQAELDFRKTTADIISTDTTSPPDLS